MKNINIDLLLTNEEHLALPKEIKWKVPYVYLFNHNGQILSYFGAKHVMEPSHPQFEILYKEWQDFLDKTKGKKSVVIYEGNVNEKNLVSLEQAIIQNGESGAIVYCAEKVGVPCFRPELKIVDEAKELLKEFSKEDIFYFFMMRGILTWLRRVNPEDFNNFITRNIQRYQNELDWENFDFSFESAIAKVHKKIFGKEFSLEDRDFLQRVPSVSFHESIINDVAKKSSVVRDIAIVKRIEKYWQEGYNIFVVYGTNHAVVQERALKDMTEA